MADEPRDRDDMDDVLRDYLEQLEKLLARTEPMTERAKVVRSLIASWNKPSGCYSPLPSSKSGIEGLMLVLEVIV